jgi:hypothetical protein
MLKRQQQKPPTKGINDEIAQSTPIARPPRIAGFSLLFIRVSTQRIRLEKADKVKNIRMELNGPE